MSLHGGGARLCLSESFQNALEVVGWIAVAAVIVVAAVAKSDDVACRSRLRHCTLDRVRRINVLGEVHA
jgi:hypothetical protein